MTLLRCRPSSASSIAPGPNHQPPNHSQPTAPTTTATNHQARVYHMSLDDFATLPPIIRQLVEGACTYQGHYFVGRAAGLARLDLQRQVGG